MSLESKQHLIDKYLSGELSSEEEKRFEEEISQSDELRKEVEISRKIYDEFSVWNKGEIKKRFDGYYQEFLSQESGENLSQDHSDSNRDDNTSKKDQEDKTFLGRYGRQILLALILIICVVLTFMYLQNEDPKEDRTPEEKEEVIKEPLPQQPSPVNDEVEEDSNEQIYLEEQIELIKPKKDSRKQLVEDIGNDISNAFQGSKKISPSQVKTVNYPQRFTYTFENRILEIQGDPLMIPLRMKIFRKGSDLYFNYKDEYYLINETSNQKAMVASPMSAQDYNISEEVIKILISSIDQLSYDQGAMDVWFSNSIERTYRFLSESNKLTLVLTGPFKAKDIKILIVNENTIYLTHKEEVYLLSKERKEVTSMKNINVTINTHSKLFQKRELIERNVLEIE